MATRSREGRRLVGGRYALEALVGRGGMGEVWRARHVALQSLVAIKFLQGSGVPSERARRRFLTEAQVTANLRTRHAVQVFDFGVAEDGRPYLVMELLEGETLDKRIAREGRLPVATTARYLQKAARALERAHALGIVHRDFKPENIMLVADEEEGGELVKVVDFGIAKLVGDLDTTLKGALGQMARREDVRPPLLEVESGGVGTPYYMAPEQVQDAADVGPAADIWAFGVVAYECLTGRRPYDDASINRLLVRVLSGTPPPLPSSIAPVPARFDDWFRVACANRPEGRFPDIASAAAALSFALESPVPQGPEPSAPKPALPGDAPTLSSRQEHGDAAARVSPLAATLGPLQPSPPSAAPSPKSSPPSVPPPPKAPPSPSPLFARVLPALLAIVAAALAFSVSVRHDPDHTAVPVVIAHAKAPEPVSVLPPTDVAIDPPRSPVEPAVVPSALPEPPAIPTVEPAAPARHRARRRPSEATMSAYRLPPLGL